MSAATVEIEKKGGVPWWLVLVEGIFAIFLGILFFVYPVRTFVVTTFFIGIYWFIAGIFDIVSIFIDRSKWGWKLFMGIIGIVAGLFLIDSTLRGAVTLAFVTAIWVGVSGMLYGILGLVRAFQGGGWGVGILSVIGFFLGLFILLNPWAATLTLPFVAGGLLLIGGVMALFMAFRLK